MKSYFLRQLISRILKEEEDKEENILGEPDLSSEEAREEESHHDEQNVSSNIAGYTLPLGASNHPTSLKQRGDIAGSGYGGAKPVKKKKKKNDADKDWYK
jgi:hypothetical protein